MSQLQPSNLFSEDTIEPSSSISQIFTNHDNTRTESSFSAYIISPPNLDVKCVARHRKIILYPALPEKILIFQDWWQATAFSQARAQGQKPSFHFGREKTATVWACFQEGALFPDGTPYVSCTACSHILQHPAVDNSGTSSMSYHLRKGCKKQVSQHTSKRTIKQMLDKGLSQVRDYQWYSHEY